MVAERTIPHYKVGHFVRFDPDEIDEWLQHNRRGPAARRIAGYVVGRRSFGAISKLPSGRWRASYIGDQTGARVLAPTTFATKADANLWLSAVAADRSRGELLDPRLSRRTFGECAREWIGGIHVKPKTYVGYESALRNHVLPVFETRVVAGITYRDCKAFVDNMLSAGHGLRGPQDPSSGVGGGAARRRDPPEPGRPAASAAR